MTNDWGVWSLGRVGLKAVCVGLTLLGQASLWLAILADTGATLLVVANALRLLRSSDWGFYGDVLASLSTINYASSDLVGSV